MKKPDTRPGLAIRHIACLLALLLPLPLMAQTAEPALEVQEIRCVGNVATSCDFIRDHLYLSPGQALDEEEIRNAALRLQALQNFESVDIRLEKGERRGAVVVVIDVKEGSPIVRESLAGASSRLDSQRAVIGARIADQNLFGNGKFADVSALAAKPIAGDAHFESYDIVARYADPKLFDSRRWFAVAKAGWHKRDTRDTHGNFTRLDSAQFDVGAGVRVGDFSYFTLGASWRPNLDWTVGRWRSDGTYVLNKPDYERTLNIAYGWNTEDDPNFPTQGSTFQLAAGGDYGEDSPGRQSHLQFRKTWHWQDSFWTFKIGGDPSPEYRNALDESQLVALSWSRPLRGGDIVRRGRWYIEPGVGLAGYDSHGRTLIETGLKVGFRADTRLFGIVDLYAIGTVDDRR